MSKTTGLQKIISSLFLSEEYLTIILQLNIVHQATLMKRDLNFLDSVNENGSILIQKKIIYYVNSQEKSKKWKES